MPIYAYRCESCGFAKDVLQKMSDPQLTQCPECGQDSFRKQVTAAGFQLKGSGWYVTDFRGGANQRGEKAGDKGSEKNGENGADKGSGKGAENGADAGNGKGAADKGSADKSAAAPAAGAAASSGNTAAAPAKASGGAGKPAAGGT